jgi:hypothetical protein
MKSLSKLFNSATYSAALLFGLLSLWSFSAQANVDCHDDDGERLAQFYASAVDSGTFTRIPAATSANLRALHRAMLMWAPHAAAGGDKVYLSAALAQALAGSATQPVLETDKVQAVRLAAVHAQALQLYLAPRGGLAQARCVSRSDVLAHVAAQTNQFRLTGNTVFLVEAKTASVRYLKSRLPQSPASQDYDRWAVYWTSYVDILIAIYAPSQQSGPTLEEALMMLWGRVALSIEPVYLRPYSRSPKPPVRPLQRCTLMKGPEDSLSVYPFMLTLLYRATVQWAVIEQRIKVPDSLSSLVRQIAVRPYCASFVRLSASNSPNAGGASDEIQLVASELVREDSDKLALAYTVSRLHANSIITQATQVIDAATTLKASSSNADTAIAQAVGDAATLHSRFIDQVLEVERMASTRKGPAWNCVDRLDQERALIAKISRLRLGTSAAVHRWEAADSPMLPVLEAVSESHQRCLKVYEGLLASDPFGVNSLQPEFASPTSRNEILRALHLSLVEHVLAADNYLFDAEPTDLGPGSRRTERGALLELVLRLHEKYLGSQFDEVVSTEAHTDIATAYQRRAKLSLDADQFNAGMAERQRFYELGLVALRLNPFDLLFFLDYSRQLVRDGRYLELNAKLQPIFERMDEQWRAEPGATRLPVEYGNHLANMRTFAGEADRLEVCWARQLVAANSNPLALVAPPVTKTAPAAVQSQARVSQSNSNRKVPAKAAQQPAFAWPDPICQTLNPQLREVNQNWWRLSGTPSDRAVRRELGAMLRRSAQKASALQ